MSRIAVLTAEEQPSRIALMNEAALLMAKLDSGSISADSVRAWRDADPRHAAALARVLGFNHEMSELRAILPQDFVERAPDRRRLLATLVGASVVGVAAISYGLVRTAPNSASTRIGEKLSVALPQGGELNVNTASKVDWKIQSDLMEVWLKAGEIALTVIEAGPRVRLHAAGHAFEIAYGHVNARLRDGLVELSVLDGAASLVGDKPAKVTAGYSLSSGPAQISQVTRIDLPASVSAWTSGELVLGGRTLASAIEEYNRYLPNKIRLGDPAIGSLKLGGRFKTNDPGSFLAALKSGFGVQSTTTDDGTIVLSR